LNEEEFEENEYHVPVTVFAHYNYFNQLTLKA